MSGSSILPAVFLAFQCIRAPVSGGGEGEVEGSSSLLKTWRGSLSLLASASGITQPILTSSMATTMFFISADHWGMASDMYREPTPVSPLESVTWPATVTTSRPHKPSMAPDVDSSHCGTSKMASAVFPPFVTLPSPTPVTCSVTTVGVGQE